MKASPSLIRLLNLFSALRELSPLDALDADEELLLNDLILRWSQNEQVTVRDLIRDERFPSPSTAYRRLMGLQDKGLVALEVAQEDRRLRYVVPKEGALRYVARLDAGLKRLVDQAQEA